MRSHLCIIREIGFALSALSVPLWAQTPVVLSADRGPALAARISHTLHAPDELVAGNGDIALMWNGAAGRFDLHYGKADFWGVVRGNITTAGELRLDCKEVQGGSFLTQQNLGSATITGNFTSASGAELSTSAWVANPQNLVVTELANTGTAPLHLESTLVDGLGTPGTASTSGTTADSTFIQVSPDIVDFEIGNRHFEKVDAPFAGSISGLQITTPGASSPFLAWNPTDPASRNIGNLQIRAGDMHGDSLLLDGASDHRLIARGGCIPQNGFTFSAWVNPSQANSDSTVFAAIANEKPTGYPYFRGFLVHLINGTPEVRLNYYTATGTTALPLNKWSEIKAVYEDQLLTLYVNGEMIAQADNPPASAQMGWDKCTLRLGDPALPFHGCAPQAILRQRVLGASELTTRGQKINFTVEPGKTADLLVSLVDDRNTADYKNVAAALANSSAADLQKFRAAHDQWWHNFWAKSFVEIPDQRIQENWYGSLYDLACCSRGDCPPPGLWYNFLSRMGAPWDGDYTLDYNYQAPFWAAYATNHFELADNYEPLLLDHISRGLSIAQNAWRMSSAGQPNSLEKYIAQRSLVKPEPNPKPFHGIFLYTHLIPVPGWSSDYGTFWNQKSNALFCCVNMIQRYRLTQDLAYARMVYPFLKGTADFWDNELILQNGHYSVLDDALCENSGDNTNPATTLSFIRLMYPTMIEISEKLQLDADRRAKWHNIVENLSPFTYIPADSVKELNKISPDLLKDKQVIRDCESKGPDFPSSPYLDYHDHKERSSSAGMNCTQTVFPGWTFGMESPEAERHAALNTVTFAAEWYDGNNDCTFYPSAASIGYDPKEILDNLHALVETYEKPNFTIKSGGGGTEDVAITTAGLTNMFVQSYQANIHVFPNWPKDQDATFGDLPACGAFLVSSQQKQEQVTYVRIVSRAGLTCPLVNPWPTSQVRLTTVSGGSDPLTSTTVTSGVILAVPTHAGDILTLTPVR